MCLLLWVVILLVALPLQLPDADPDTPWYCCLHPDPQLASCLVPEEPHDMNTSAATDPTLSHVSYANCIGFRPAHRAAAGAAEGDEELHAQNVAHFSAVVAAAASGIAPGDDLLVLGWLAKQRPEALLTGVTVPRELRQLAPEYGGSLVGGGWGLGGVRCRGQLTACWQLRRFQGSGQGCTQVDAGLCLLAHAWPHSEVFSVS